MKRVIRRIINGIKFLCIIIFTFLLFPFARIILWHKKIWIVSEYGYEARDNGYSFFKYMRKNHQEINCYYAIDFKSTDYFKIKELGNAIKFGSFKHFAYFCAARYIISSKTQGFCPSYYLTVLRKKFHLWGKYVFLQHGITKDDQKSLYKRTSKIDLFICGAKPEYDDIKKHYGYRDNEVAYTGFSRFDDYFDLNLKNKILVMPTWRRYAVTTNFTDTLYFKTWSNFLNSNELNSILKEHNLNLYFYLHPQFKDCLCYFETNLSNIKILPFDNTDFQSMIRSSIMFVTDFSSLAFDFGYMNKPVIYYQYDENDFFKKHYIKGYFDYRRDGFGDVVNTFEEFLRSFQLCIDNKMTVEEKYKKQQTIFFPVHDNENSRRIFDAIQKI